MLPIGGLKEKIYAAVRAGIRKVLIPYDNRNEVKEFDKEILKNIKIIPISNAMSILEHTLTKSINPLNITESELLEAQKSTKAGSNIKENLTH